MRSSSSSSYGVGSAGRRRTTSSNSSSSTRASSVLEQAVDQRVEDLVLGLGAGRHDRLGLVEEVTDDRRRDRHAVGADLVGELDHHLVVAVGPDAYVAVSGRLLHAVTQEVAQNCPVATGQCRVVGLRGEAQVHRQRVTAVPGQAQDRDMAVSAHAVVADDHLGGDLRVHVPLRAALEGPSCRCCSVPDRQVGARRRASLERVADPASYRPAPGTIPDDPGVYKFRDEHGRVIYVGKAKSLRSRLSSYFQDTFNLHPRTQTMVRTAAAVEWTVVSTEVEALQLEYSWIKEFDPRFNVRYRDDKSYPWLAVTLDEEFPRAQVMRGAKRRGVKYFGPYAHAWAIRETLDALLRVFPMRTCSNGVFKRAGQVGRPCLLGYIDKCSAPCVGRVDADRHRRITEDFVDFMSGQTQRYVKRLEREMRDASRRQEYERAARLRDDIGALNRTLEKQAVVLGDGTDADVVAFAQDQLEAAVQVFYVRGGRVRGQRGWVVDK